MLLLGCPGSEVLVVVAVPLVAAAFVFTLGLLFGLVVEFIWLALRLKML
jgi:hypothetical protein